MPVLRSNNPNNNTGAGGPPSAPSSLNGTPSLRPSPPRRPARRQRKPETAAFHPKLITAQIVSMQCMHYFLLSFLFQVNYVLYNIPITIDRIFTDQYVRLWGAQGWADVAAILITSLAGSVLLAIIVEKSKKCLDFSVTLFLLHLLISTMYGGFPSRLDWWVVHVFGTIIMVIVGEYLCSLKELNDIPLLQL